jgi:hypothetical protein
MVIEIAISLIELHGPNGQRVEVNPAQVSSVRVPRIVDHFAPGTKCVVFMTDGKFATVTDDCDSVEKKLEEAK